MSKVDEFYRELEQKGFSMQDIDYMLQRQVDKIKDMDIDCDIEAKTIGVENE